LPLKLPSGMAPPEGSMMTNSGDGRGTGAAAANEEQPSARRTAKAIFRRRIV
jgi:hypothetical protein